jgi:hypothetical protein
MTKLRMMRCVEHVGRMGRKGMRTVSWWENQNEGDHYEDLDLDGSIILKWTLEK